MWIGKQEADRVWSATHAGASPVTLTNLVYGGCSVVVAFLPVKEEGPGQYRTITPDI